MKTARRAWIPLGLRIIAALVGAHMLAACGSAAPAGTACTRPSDCQSGFCLRRSTGSVCATTCASSADCTGGDICGRFDFRTVDGDSGSHSGMSSDVVYVCRPPMTVACASSADCSGSTPVCTGTPGVCSNACASNAACASAMCLPSDTAACGVGTCAPQCDDVRECPRGWYCDQSLVDTLGHGRCLVITGDDAGTPPDATCPSDASTADP